MKIAASAAVMALFAAQANADIYMHAPAGSNNRNCRTDNNKERQNANRVFDSQNNDNGGYSCPRAWPFDCYKVIDDNNAFNQCRAQNDGNANEVNSAGDLVNPNAVNTPRPYYYSGSTLSIEWSAQHGMGTNSELYSDVIVQYACEDTLTDNCQDTPAGASPYIVDPNQQTCVLRDGTPTKTNGNQLNDQATNRIPDNEQEQDDYRYGRHETYQYYQECKNRERNKGLWTADQNVQGNDARGTRQNPNQNRNGLECPEESEYYPYWHYSPWKDVAIVTSDASQCAYYQAESQNVKPRGRCECNGGCNGNGNQPNNEAACTAAGFTWVMDAAHGIPPPDCVVGQYSRQNHLGNVGGGANAQTYNWTIPETVGNKEQTCTLRIRYNMSSSDFGDVVRTGTSLQNGNNSPLKDNDENEALGYIPVQGMTSGAKLHFAVNTDQYARTFQDRSYVFHIRPRPAELSSCTQIYNLQTRGKRGNIVQAYPAVEYDFTPDHLLLEETDCVHVQWSGTDYNPNRNGNNAEGGPYASDDQNKETKADRANMVQQVNPADNVDAFNSANFKLFSDATLEDYKRLAFLDQDIDGPECWDFDQLQQEYNNRAEREETYHNCMKLSNQATPYFDLGVKKAPPPGSVEFISTRNNNFSNRGMKGRIDVVEPGTKPVVQPDGTVTPPGTPINTNPGGVTPPEQAIDAPSGSTQAASTTALIAAGVGVAVLAVGGFIFANGNRKRAAAKAAPAGAMAPGGYGQQAGNPYYGQ